ncbi:MAG TPA: dihydroneopterin aldolase [Caulobacteraceae bacterium]|jgi:dihydroneopterin aldolase
MANFQTRVFVRNLRVEAEIGLHAHEQGRRQPLFVDVELDLAGEPWTSIHATVDYEKILAHARAVAAEGHVLLVETYAWRVAQACLGEAGVTRARVRVEKPLALAPDAEGAGVEVIAENR